MSSVAWPIGSKTDPPSHTYNTSLISWPRESPTQQELHPQNQKLMIEMVAFAKSFLNVRHQAVGCCGPYICMGRCAGPVAQLTHNPIKGRSCVDQFGSGAAAVHVGMNPLAYVGLASKCLEPVIYVTGMDCGPLALAGLAKKRPTGFEPKLPALIKPPQKQHFCDAAKHTLAISATFAVADMHLMSVEVYVLDIEIAQLAAAQSRGIQQAENCLITYAQSTTTASLQQFTMFIVSDNVGETCFFSSCIHFQRFRDKFCFHAPMLVLIFCLYSRKFSFRYNFFGFSGFLAAHAVLFDLLNCFTTC